MRLSDALDKLSFAEFEKKYDGPGRPPYAPRLMVGLIMYGLLKGINSLRGLESMSQVDLGCMWLCSGIQPDHSNIGRFILRHQEEFEGPFFEMVTRLALRVTKTGVGDVAGDGTVIQAAASRYRTVKREALDRKLSESQEASNESPDDEEKTARGSVTFCQRFGGAININPHFHVLQLDGVYATDEGKATPVFVPAPTLEDEDVKRIVETTAQRVIGLLARRGILDGDQLDPLAEESPLLAGVTAASVQGMIATGERAGMRVRRVLSDPAEGVRTGHLCYASRGLTANDEGTNSSSRLYLCSYLNYVHFATQSYRSGLVCTRRPALRRAIKSVWSGSATMYLGRLWPKGV